MSQLTYRANLTSRAFAFLSFQFGRSVISAGPDQVNSLAVSESSGGDSNIPQAYYMHNVVPTSQGFKSVGYKQIILAADSKVTFDRVIPVRDPSTLRGLLGITIDGKLYICIAGENSWTAIPIAISAAWGGRDISVAYVNGSTYICLSLYKVFRVDVENKTLIEVDLAGVIDQKIVAITAAAGYLILTDGVAIYWSSTISPEDFVPSQVTGAGSGKPNDAEGRIIALASTAQGFAVYTDANIVIALYSQNPRFPWIFRRVENSKGLTSSQQLTSAAEDSSNYVWTSAGLQRISSTGAATVMAEVTDFLAGQEFEDWDDEANVPVAQYLDSPLKLKLTFVGGRYLVASYGIDSLTHALLYDIPLKRWGKLKVDHTACFEVNMNSEGFALANKAAVAKHTLGFVKANGEVYICDFANNAEAIDSVLLLGKYQLIRTRTTTLEKICVESSDGDAEFSVIANSTLDGKNMIKPVIPFLSQFNGKYKEYSVRTTGLNHSLIFKGSFNLNSLELVMHINGRR